MDRLVLFMIGLTVAWGALAFGAVYEWAHRPLLAMAAAAGVLAWLTSTRSRLGWPIALATLVTIAAVALQLVPLDAATIARISPGTDRILRQVDLQYAMTAASGAPTSHPLSVVPAMTITGLTSFLCASALTLGTARWLSRDRLRQLAIFIAALGTVMALVGLIQRAVSPQLIYGFWKPWEGLQPFGPFVNKNHFAGWILMVLPVTLGLSAGLAVRSFRHAPRDWRYRLLQLQHRDSLGAAMAGFGALAMSAALLVTLSRSGILSAAVAMAAGWLFTTRAVRGWARLLLVVAIVLPAAAVAFVGIDVLSSRFGSLNAVGFEARAGMWRDTWRMFNDVPLAGVGIGAFSVANLFYQTGLPTWHVGAAHNDWLQLLAEGGLLVALPALLLLAVLVVEIGRRFREHRAASDYGTTFWIRTGVSTGLVAICMQSLVDFSLQMPGNTMMFATLWAMAIAPMRPE